MKTIGELPENIRKQIDIIKNADYEGLKKHLCPFYAKGGLRGCAACMQDEAQVEACRDYYLEKIEITPMEVWDATFGVEKIIPRETLPIDEVVGIGVACDRCYMYDKCPLYKKGYACAIQWNADCPETPQEFMEFLVNLQYERVKRHSIFERVDGGVPDAGLSGEMDRLQNYTITRANMNRATFSVNVEASMPGGVSGGGGILAKLFGGGISNALPDAPPASVPIEAEAVVVKANTEQKDE